VFLAWFGWIIFGFRAWGSHIGNLDPRVAGCREVEVESLELGVFQLKMR
jgi:hypothetical protein